MKARFLACAILFLPSCGKLGPECTRLSDCCDSMDEALGRDACLETLDEHGSEEGAESICRSAVDTLELAGSCKLESAPSEDPDPPTPASCEALRVCCAQISSGPYRSDCLVAVGQMELQPNAQASCRSSLEGYVLDGWCGTPTVVQTEGDDQTCSDGIDNDGDGFLDCDDYDCSRNPSVFVCG